MPRECGADEKLNAMSITTAIGSVVATPDEQIGLSTLFSVTPGATDPTYLILSGLDRDEYTAGYNTADMGTLSGNGAIQTFTNVESDAWSVGIVFTYQSATGRYYNSTYGYFDQLTYTASSNTNDNSSLSIFTTSNASLASQDASNPYTLEGDPGSFSYVGSVGVVTQPSFAGPAPTQATPDSVCAAAESFVGKTWNMDGCWVLTSNISAEAGASLSASSTLVGVPGLANGEWIVAYDGTVSANASWEQNVTAGDIIGFVTTSGGGHITTVVSGSGSSALLIDNITYINGNGSIQNSANDGDPNDLIIAAAHPATQEFDGVNPSYVVVYELDTPTVSDLQTSVTLNKQASESLASMFSATNPLASQSITEWQIYESNASDSITVSGIAQSGDTSAAGAASVTSLSNAALLAGSVAGTDTIEVRAYNGSYWGDWRSLTATVTGIAATNPPTVTDQTANQTWTQGQTVNLTLPANTFTDPQGQTLSHAASQSNGQALPSWLSFNGSTDTFSGTVTGGMQSLTLKITATDASGLSVSETFGVTVPAAAPTVTDQTSSQTWTQGQKFSLALPANTFTDPQGEKLTYTASQSSGQALPSWLSFNATTQTFSGTVPAGVENLTVKVTATDTSKLSGSEAFGVTVAAEAPTLTDQTANQTWLQGQKALLALPAKTFTDPQSETLTYTVAQSNGQPLPSWLSFNATTKIFSAIVPTTGAESLSLTVTATDTSSLCVNETFGVTVPAAVAPTLTDQTANQTWIQDAKVSLILPTNTFTDPQSQTLTYSATQSNGEALPSWLSFNATTRTFSGTAPLNAANLTLEVTATDASGMSTSETFGATVPAAAAPVVADQTTNQTWIQGQKVSLTLPSKTFTDPQNETLTYTASQSNGQGLPSWLSFNATTRTFSGTVPTTGAESLTLMVTATDASGAYNDETFGVTVPAAVAPTVTDQTAAQTWRQGQKISLVLSANTFADPQNEALTYVATQSNGQALPSWLSFNATTRTFSGTVPAGMESLILTVRATDTSGLSTTETFSATVPAAAPTVTDQTAGQTWTQGQTISVALPANAFTDPQSETLTYNAAQSNGQALPSWLSFNAATETLSGTVPAGMANLTLKVTATDTSNLSVSETFGLTVPAAAPTVTDQTANQTWTQGQTVSLALPVDTFTDPQNEKLTYTASQSNGQALPTWLKFNATTCTFSGTEPTSGASPTLKITATDTSHLSASETFGVTVVASGLTLAAGATSSPSDSIALSGSGFTVEFGAGYDKLQFLSGAGNETVVLQAGGTDEISGFNLGAGDVLDLRTLIAQSHLDLATVSANIAAYATVSDQGTSADLLFDPSGHSGGSVVAILDNLGSAITRLADLTSHGELKFS
jgi:large repetitive protein